MRIASQESCYSQSISGFIYNLLQTPLFKDQKSVTDVSTSVPHHTFCIKFSVNNPNWHRVQAGEVCWWLRTSWGSPRGSQTSMALWRRLGGISLWQDLLWPQKETFGLWAFGGFLAFRATSTMCDMKGSERSSLVFCSYHRIQLSPSLGFKGSQRHPPSLDPHPLLRKTLSAFHLVKQQRHQRNLFLPPAS